MISNRTLVVFPAPLTDHRIFEPIRASFPNLNCLDYELVEQQFEEDPQSLDDYARAFAREIQRRGLTGPEPIWLGGICMGGMVALLVANRLRELDPELRIEGILLLGSACSFTRCLGPVQRRGVNALKQLAPRPFLRAGISLFVRAQAWRGPLNRIVRARRDAALAGDGEPGELGKLYSEMVSEREPRHIVRRLVAESSFDFEALDAAQLPPILHVHGSRDALLPLEKVKAARAAWLERAPVDYRLEVIEGGGHFLTLTHREPLLEILAGHFASRGR